VENLLLQPLRPLVFPCHVMRGVDAQKSFSAGKRSPKMKNDFCSTEMQGKIKIRHNSGVCRFRRVRNTKSMVNPRKAQTRATMALYNADSCYDQKGKPEMGVPIGRENQRFSSAAPKERYKFARANDQRDEDNRQEGVIIRST